MVPFSILDESGVILRNQIAPVLIVGHIRKELILRRLLEMNAQDRIPEVVYLSIDGPKNAKESEMIADIRETVENMRQSLKFALFVNYSEFNLGVDRHIENRVSNLLLTNSQIVVVEDDIRCSHQFYSSMLHGLKLLELNQEKFLFVLGFAPSVSVTRFFYKVVKFWKNDYWRESKYFCAWGWATNCKAWQNFTHETDRKVVEKRLSDSKSWCQLSSHQRSIWLDRFARDNYDYQIQRYLFEQNKKTLVPNKRLIDNEGFGEMATHTKIRPRVLGPEGLSKTVPINLREFSIFRQKVQDFFDSWMWAGDTWLHVRGRKAGLRSRVRNLRTEWERWRGI